MNKPVNVTYRRCTRCVMDTTDYRIRLMKQECVISVR